ncbi:hypothetical protein DL93DRAFT_1317721 [Clavulina sp. PMI_390]|nr:hypothetical protein DL93DRAFT_1317721 [Clavulina sp. PMI_390]
MKRETLLLATQFITSLVPTNDPLDSCAQEMWESSRKLAEIELNVIREPALATSSKLRSIFDVVVHIPDSIIPEGDLYSFRQRCQRILDLPSSPRQGFAHENTHPAITSTMQSTKCLSTGTLAPLNPIIPAPLPSSSYSSVPPPHRSENGSGTAKQPHWQFHQPNYTKRGRADVSEAHDGGAKRLKQ